MFGHEKEKVSRDRDKRALQNSHRPKSADPRIITAILYLLSLVFLILVEIGNINNKAVIRDTYFLKIDMSNIIPESVPNAILINSIARSIGLHDFYQVGLWGFCEGYKDEGITYCSPPRTLYWFNPVEIIQHELISGARVSLPDEIVSVLDLVKTVSQWMFACFLVGTVLTFLCILSAPIGFSKRPRLQHKAKSVFLSHLPIIILTFGALLFTGVAAVIATVMFVIYVHTFASASTINIYGSLGKPMLAFMWTAVGLNLIGFCARIRTWCSMCCCTGRRKAIRKGQENSYDGATVVNHDSSRDDGITDPRAPS